MVWLRASGAAAAVLVFAPSMSAANTNTPQAPRSHVTLHDGQVEVRKNKSTSLQMYLPNSGALAGGNSSAVLAAAFSMNKAGTSITLKSGYHARNNKAIRGYMTSHLPGAQGARGSLSAHWTNEAGLYNDIRHDSFDAIPSLELEGLHELGISKTLPGGLSVSMNARSKDNQQSVTTTLGYSRGSVRYNAMLTKSLLGSHAMHGKQHVAFALGKAQVNGGMLLRTALNGALETFPYAAVQIMVKGIRFDAAYKRDPKLHIAGQPIQSTHLKATKAMMNDRLMFSADVAMRSAVGADGMLSSILGLSYSAQKHENTRLDWTFRASATVLQGGGRGEAFGTLSFDQTDPLRSAINTLSADMRFKLTPKTQLGLKGAARHMASTLGTYNRVTLATFVKHGLWDFEAMAGLNNAKENADAMLDARGGLHHRFAQKAFGQFSHQRAIFSLKAKYSY